MRDQISAAVGPISLVWETQRLRRLRAALLQAAAPEGVDQILKRRVDPFTREDRNRLGGTQA
jgi:hypothetical protein